ncbi:hypothetical protein PRIPAC_87686 [Pristionchus pacificus]|uniref:Uncharacterized protein n=1 Tax=Pristionchus pacificus TaxID=54126 RepID=A0A2A6CXI1_PRIPA|nr:hypothetical protein PRIPAC_87686 [Pristionchus pacificus]|eukprot:PDM82731.1 hypothetical protein PRIPAC_37124 [Pristionchus pacificus]
MARKLVVGLALMAVALADSTGEDIVNNGEKRRQYVARPVVAAAPVLPVVAAQPAVVAPVGQCPGGPSLPIECDPKRPWPQCPPQSYCYATNSVDIGPYFCCPIWSTYGAAWRPATPFYNYVPPPPPNWGPELGRLVANWPSAAVGIPAAYAPLKAKKQQNFNADDDAEEEKKEDKIAASINSWMERRRA